MADSPDWTDETLRPLNDLARLAFPDGGVTADTLKRRARQGKLAVYRPGKAYLASLSGVRVMIGKTRVLGPEERPAPAVPNSLGLTEIDLARMRCERALEELCRPARDAKRLRDEERAREAPARQAEALERRRARARAKYREKKADSPFEKWEREYDARKTMEGSEPPARIKKDGTPAKRPGPRPLRSD